MAGQVVQDVTTVRTVARKIKRKMGSASSAFSTPVSSPDSCEVLEEVTPATHSGVSSTVAEVDVVGVSAATY